MILAKRKRGLLRIVKRKLKWQKCLVSRVYTIRFYCAPEEIMNLKFQYFYQYIHFKCYKKSVWEKKVFFIPHRFLVIARGVVRWNYACLQDSCPT